MRYIALHAVIIVAVPVAAAAQDRCEVRAPSLELSSVVVAPRGTSPFSLAVTGAEITARPTAAAGPHEVSVRAGLSFEGRTSALSYSLGRPLRVAAGMLELSTAVRLRRVRERGRDVSSTVGLGLGVSVLGVGLPCAALVLGDPPPASAEPAAGPPDGDGTHWIPRTHTLTFRTRPGAGVAMVVRAEILVLLSMSRSARRGEHFRLRWRAGDGTSLVGWVHRDSVRPMPQGVVCATASGSGRAGCEPLGLRSEAGLYRGPGEIRLGAQVYSEPAGRGPWATFAVAEPVLVEHDQGAAWVRVLSAPGVRGERACRYLAHAWVAREDVTLPDDVDARRM